MTSASAQYQTFAGQRAAHALREAWRNPPDLVQRVPNVVPGYPDRLLPVDDKAATLEERTAARAALTRSASPASG